MSSLIFLAADKRVMMPHSTFMFHDGTMAQEGTVKQFYTEYEQTKIQEDQMLQNLH
jgi:ATP-dependent protease ClpP protease subunit